MKNTQLQTNAINTIRFLSVDAVQQAKSGHAGLPMGAAAIGYTLFKKHLRFNPKNPDWADRDRFILSAGHGSMLLYSLLYLTGYDLPFNELKRFRQLGSLAPGHPERQVTPGVEATTGPLGQGLATAVGMAMAEAHLAAVYNKPGYDLFNHYTYVLASDGDLMEGITGEAGSIAGHFKLGKLICFYDDNHVTIDGPTDISFSEDCVMRYKAYGWQTIIVKDGNDVNEIDQAIKKAKKEPKPSMIVCRTHLGYGYPTWQDKSIAHAGIPSEEELIGAKKALGYPIEPHFFVSDKVLAHFRTAITTGQQLESEWNQKFEDYSKEFHGLSDEITRRLQGALPKDIESVLPSYSVDLQKMPTRAASNEVINKLTEVLPELMGGSADLSKSNATLMKDMKGFQVGQYEGRYIYFGVREHAMGAITNGLAIHDGIIPYAGTFLVFSDYLRPALRMSALSQCPSIWIFSHDSFCLGEDGPTHQPIEQLPSLRAIPNLITIRPSDANETVEAWKIALQRREEPVAILLTRQPVPIFDRSIYNSAAGLKRGAYVMKDFGKAKPDLIMMSSGSEVQLIVNAGAKLAKEGFNIRLVSFPSWELFKEQDKEYQDQVLLPDVTKRLSVEAGSSLGWHRWVGQEGKTISIDRFGASAPNAVLYDTFGFNLDNVLAVSKELLEQ